jgi:hypothetical protein
VELVSEEKTNASTAACAACFAGEIAWVYTSRVDRNEECWIFRGMSITHSEVKPIICSEANRSSIPRHADQRFRGQADQEFAAVGMI